MERAPAFRAFSSLAFSGLASSFCRCACKVQQILWCVSVFEVVVAGGNRRVTATTRLRTCENRSMLHFCSLCSLLGFIGCSRPSDFFAGRLLPVNVLPVQTESAEKRGCSCRARALNRQVEEKNRCCSFFSSSTLAGEYG